MYKNEGMPRDEEKSKKIVEFYCFWKFHYCTRNFWLEIDRVVNNGSKNAVRTISDEHKIILKKIYLAHPLSRMGPKFFEGEDYNEIDEILAAGNGITFQKPHEFLELLCMDGEPDKSYIEDDFHGCLKILGTNGMYISKNGELRGKIIAEIDLSSSLDSISLEISRLKQARFQEFPNFVDSPEFNSLDADPNLVAKLIKMKSDSSFSVNDDPARAIGLWFWDMLCGPEPVFENFAELWSVIATQKNDKFYIGDNIQELISNDFIECESKYKDVFNINEQYDMLLTSRSQFFTGITPIDCPIELKIIPTIKAFSKLGYAASDPSVFRRLYRNTAKCIEACEVLSLK